MRTTADEASGHRSVTIADVAARAGVSTATVSRTLNSDYPVALRTKEKVLAAAKALGYTANAHARALASSSTHTVGIILNDVVDPFFSYVARGVEMEAAASQRLCIIAAAHGSTDRELELIDRMREQRADAVIVVGGSFNDPTARRETAKRAAALANIGSVLVLCGRPPLGPGTPAKVVGYDNEGGAFAVTEHLIERGHRRILYLGGPHGLSTTIDRLAGYRRALRLHGIDPVEELIHEGAFGRRFGNTRMREILQTDLDYTAVFAANDLVAAGALQALTDAGVRVPEDVSLVGYDDIPQSFELNPQLTTVHVPLEEMGRTAVRVALAKTADAFGRHDEDETIVGTRVVARQSVAAPGPGVQGALGRE